MDGQYNWQANYGSNFNHYEQQKAPNIFQQFVLAFVPTQYGRLTKVKTGSMIGFVTLLVLAATLLSFVSVALMVASFGMGELAGQMPDFVISNGRLYMDEDFLYDETGMFIYMTEDIDSFSYEDAAEIAEDGYQHIILMGRDRISIMQNGEYQQADFDNFGNGMEISKEWLVSILGPFLMVVLVLGYIIAFVVRVGWYFLCAAVYLLFGMIIASVMNKRLETGDLFRTAVYAKVLMFVIGTLLGLVPFVSLSVPFLLRVVITIVFMGLAIAKLPDNYPNNPFSMTMGQGRR